MRKRRLGNQQHIANFTRQLRVIPPFYDCLLDHTKCNMTINSVRTIVTDRRLPSPPPNGYPQAAPKVYPAPDFPFKGWQPPQPEGYSESAATPSESAIVIDNGISSPSFSEMTKLTTLVLKEQVRSKQDGPSTKSPGSSFHLSSPDFETATTTRHAHMSATMPTQTPPPVDRYGTPLSHIRASSAIGTSWKVYLTLLC